MTYVQEERYMEAPKTEGAIFSCGILGSVARAGYANFIFLMSGQSRGCPYFGGWDSMQRTTWEGRD